LRTAHWPDGAADHGPEIAAFFAGTAPEPQAVFLAECDGRAIAVMELSIRKDLPMLPNVEVGYVEGLYIEPEFRGRGITRRLLRFAQDWAHKERCAAFASDRDGRIILDPRYRLKEAEPALA
jgi:aminoglycoside 6'-N-acetyltransferase I